MVSGRVPRVLRASQQLYDVFCQRSRAVPLGALLPPLGERESKHLTSVRREGWGVEDDVVYSAISDQQRE